MLSLPLCLNSFREQCGKNDLLSASYNHTQISSCISVILGVSLDYCFSTAMPVSHVMGASLTIFWTHSVLDFELPVLRFQLIYFCLAIVTLKMAADSCI